MKVFINQNITEEELTAIENWTDDSEDIKAVMWGMKDNNVEQVKRSEKWTLIVLGQLEEE